MSPTGGNGNGGIPPTPLTVEVSLDAADAEFGTLLGWSAGRVPGAEIRVERENVDGSIDDPLVATTDAEGRASFPTILQGTHRVAALKVLNEEEQALVTPSRPLLRAFGGGDKATGGGTFSLSVHANLVNSIVVSELSTVDSAGGDGIWFGYVELYNNSPDVRYLHGMLIGRLEGWQHAWSSRSCSGHAQYSNDPDGIWTRLFQRFPGTGGQYPVQPGETVVIAFDAIDHSQHRSWQLDLSNADFEMRTQSDADNPAVPDLIDAGPRAALQSGIQILYGIHPAFLARPVDTSTLPQARAIQPVVDDIFVRIPTDVVADVLDPIHGHPSEMICPRGMHSNFSRLPYVWKRRSGAHLMSQQRRPIGTAPGGWTILLDTKTSAVDFMEADRTLEAVPLP